MNYAFSCDLGLKMVVLSKHLIWLMVWMVNLNIGLIFTFRDARFCYGTGFEDSTQVVNGF